MGVELIRKAVCDRCGHECSHFEERTLHEDVCEGYNLENVCEQYDLKVKRFTKNVFRYTEMTLQGFDSRFECRKNTFVLCGKCVDSLGKWMKNKRD